MPRYLSLLLAFFIGVPMFSSLGWAEEPPVYKIEVPYVFRELHPYTRKIIVCASVGTPSGGINDIGYMKAGQKEWFWGYVVLDVPPSGNISGTHFFEFMTPTEEHGSYKHFKYWHAWFKISNGEDWFIANHGPAWTLTKSGTALEEFPDGDWQSESSVVSVKAPTLTMTGKGKPPSVNIDSTATTSKFSGVVNVETKKLFHPSSSEMLFDIPVKLDNMPSQAKAFELTAKLVYIQKEQTPVQEAYEDEPEDQIKFPPVQEQGSKTTVLPIPSNGNFGQTLSMVVKREGGGVGGYGEFFTQAKLRICDNYACYDPVGPISPAWARPKSDTPHATENQQQWDHNQYHIVMPSINMTGIGNKSIETTSSVVIPEGSNTTSSALSGFQSNAIIPTNDHAFSIPVELENLATEVKRLKVTVEIYDSSSADLGRKEVEKDLPSSGDFSGTLSLKISKKASTSKPIKYKARLLLCSDNTCQWVDNINSPDWAKHKPGTPVKSDHTAELPNQAQIDVPELKMTGKKAESSSSSSFSGQSFHMQDSDNESRAGSSSREEAETNSSSDGSKPASKRASAKTRSR